MLDRIDVAFELGEDLLQRLAHHVREHVQPPAVRHADDDLMHVAAPPRARASHRGSRSAVSAPSSAESLLPHEPRMQEVLKLFRREQSAPECACACSRSSGQSFASRLHPLLQPALLLRRLDVHVLARRSCRNRSGAAFRESRAASPPASAPPSPITSPSEPVRNSRSRSQIVRP